MLIFFFILIFIAEVKITYDIVCLIRHIDEKVCHINDEISAINPKLESSFISIRIALNKTLLALNKVQLRIKEKKEEFKIIILKNLLTGILFFILKAKGHKVLSVVELAFDIKDFYKKWSKVV